MKKRLLNFLYGQYEDYDKGQLVERCKELEELLASQISRNKMLEARLQALESKKKPRRQPAPKKKPKRPPAPKKRPRQPPAPKVIRVVVLPKRKKVRRKRVVYKFSVNNLVTYQDELYFVVNTKRSATTPTYSLVQVGGNSRPISLDENSLDDEITSLSDLDDNDLNWLALYEPTLKKLFTPIYGVRLSQSEIAEKRQVIWDLCSNMGYIEDGLLALRGRLAQLEDANNNDLKTLFGGASVGKFFYDCEQCAIISTVVDSIHISQLTSVKRELYWNRNFMGDWNITWGRAKKLAVLGELVKKYPKISLFHTVVTNIMPLLSVFRLLLDGNPKLIRELYQQPDADIINILQD